MRIAHVTATFPPYYAGTGNVCFQNARALGRRGHTVHVFTAAVRGAAEEEIRDGVSVHRLHPWLRLGNAPVLPALLSRLRGFDIIHLHAPFILGAEMTAGVAALTRIPLIVTYHNDLVRSGTWRDAVFRLATWSLRHLALYRADRVLFVSLGHAETSDQRGVRDRFPEKTRVLVNGVDTELFCPAPDQAEVRAALGFPAGAPLIGFVGALDLAHHYKGLEILLQATAAPQLSHTLLLVVGDGELRAKHQRQAHDLGLDQRVRFHGGVPQSELPPLMRACDILAIPSLVPESISLTMLESMACGVPVIISDGPGVRSVLSVGEDGLLAKSGDVADLVEKISLLLEDPERRRGMGARSRAKIEAGYSWEQIGLRLEAIYQEVLDSSTRD